MSKYHIYCDESCQNAHKYLVISAIYCDPTTAKNLAKSITTIQEKHGSSGELKWSKIKRLNIDMYDEIYQLLAKLAYENHIQICALVVDTTKADHKKYSNGDADLGFTKFLFTMLYNFASRKSKHNNYFVYLDDRTTKHTTEKLRETLNTKSSRLLECSPFRIVEFADSATSKVIQAADLISGIVAYEANMKHLALNASDHKKEILRRAKSHFKLHTFGRPTSTYLRSIFNIWFLKMD